MTSEKQSKANRRNALKSSGPRTPEGKNVVRLNAVKHGLLSQTVLLPGEDAETLKKLGESLRAELQPVGDLEGMFVDRIIAAHWRLRRLGQVGPVYSPTSTMAPSPKTIRWRECGRPMQPRSAEPS
jgi:hypothetical protein